MGIEKAPASLEAEYMDISNRNAWPQVFQKIARECHLYPYTYKESKKQQNKALNRYRDVNPYDHSRIVLTRCQNDYINANLVKMERADRRYILTQGPLLYTAGHFWAMIWEQNSRAILMLNRIIEKNEIKCHLYWPESIGEEHKIEFCDERLAVEQVSCEDFNYYVMRNFKLTDTDSGESRNVVQFHYTTWPDFGVPSSPVAFLKFLEKVRASGALDNDVGPAVVHCSAGIGRSGTFCLVDVCLVIIEKEGMDNINVQGILMEMRKDRMGLIQTPDQLRFSYQAIIEGAKRLDPNWKELDESIYSKVPESESEEEGAPPPPPPPRGDSLARPPPRPLPAIPTSASMEEDMICAEASSSEEEEEEEEGPPPPARPFLTPPSSDEDEEIPLQTSSSAGDASEAGGGATEGARRRRAARELSARLDGMRKRARDADRWHALERSLFKPLSILSAVLLAGAFIYAYVKH